MYLVAQGDSAGRGQHRPAVDGDLLWWHPPIPACQEVTG